MAARASTKPAAPPQRRGPGRPRKDPNDKSPVEVSTVKLPADYLRRLRILAAVRGNSTTRLAEQAVEEWFKRNPLPKGL
jgi:hypothetical protein